MHNICRLVCHRRGLSTGEISRDRHERRIFWQPFLHRLVLCRRRMPARRTAGVTGACTWSPSNWGRILGLEVNWQKTMRQLSGCPSFRHSVGVRGGLPALVILHMLLFISAPWHIHCVSKKHRTTTINVWHSFTNLQHSLVVFGTDYRETLFDYQLIC